MNRYFLHRLAYSALTLLLVSIAVFLLGYLSGDPVGLMVPPEARADDIERVRKSMGFDRPLLVQYGDYLWRTMQGDLGISLWQKQPVLGLILEHLPATLELTTASMLIAVGLAVPLGVLAAINKSRAIDRLSMVLAVLGQSVPSFWLGIMLIFLFAVFLHWLPSSGRGTWRHLVLPAITLAAFPMARLARLTRSGMLDVLGQEYIETARAKGLRERTILIVHALRNAAISLVTVLGLQIGALLGGAVVVETIFAWPGIGFLVTQAIHARDFPLVRAAVLLLGLAFILINLAVDITYGFLDPRITDR